MRVLILGGGGYLGTTFARRLLESGHEVTILDRFFWGTEIVNELIKTIRPCSTAAAERLRVLRGDTRGFATLPHAQVRSILGPQDAIINLAAFPVDHWCELNESTSVAVNEWGTEAVFQYCRLAKIEKVVFPSSCSSYGVCGNEWVDEQSELKPYTLYARGKQRMEQLLQHEYQDVNWVIGRLATLFGLSLKMRLDIVVNIMSVRACQERKIIINGEGEQWRPLLHVTDAARALEILLTTDQPIRHEVCNIGDNELVLRVRDLPERIKAGVGLDDVQTVHVEGNHDPRSHRMNCEKFQQRFGFKASVEIEQGAREIAQAMQSHQLNGDPRWQSVKWLNSLRYYHRYLHESGSVPAGDPLDTVSEMVEITDHFLDVAGQTNE